MIYLLCLIAVVLAVFVIVTGTIWMYCVLSLWYWFRYRMVPQDALFDIFCVVCFPTLWFAVGRYIALPCN